jgi:hypothetical protein
MKSNNLSNFEGTSTKDKKTTDNSFLIRAGLADVKEIKMLY